MDNGISEKQSNLQKTDTHPLSSESDTTASSVNIVSNIQGDGTEVLPRIRIISLHLLLYLYKNDHDYVFMTNVLREILDWLEKNEDFMKLKLPNDSKDCLFDLSIVKKPPVQSPVCDNAVEVIISEFLDSELPDSEIVNKIEKVDGFEIVDSCADMIEGFKNPLYVWQFMFDADDYSISQFIKPLQTGNFGVIVKLKCSNKNLYLMCESDPQNRLPNVPSI